MPDFYILTRTGSQGPYSATVIQRGVAEGRIPPNAQLVDARSGQNMRAADVRADALAAASGNLSSPADAPVPGDFPGATASPAQTFRTPPNLGGNYPRGPYPGPAQSYPQYPYPPAPYPPQAPTGQHSYTQPYGQAYGNAPQYQPGMYPQARPQSALAIASLVLSLVTPAICLPTWIGGIVCGVKALKECEPHGPKQGRGLAMAGLWIGIIFGLLYVPAVALWVFAILADA